MFTGLVEEVGTVLACEVAADGARLTIGATEVLVGLAVGDSVAVDGVCLTATSVDHAGFTVDAVSETLARTALGTRAVGDRINLERALRVGDRLGGHIVQGHVDGTGVIGPVDDLGAGGARVWVSADETLLRYIVEKGSITIDGVSLTVASRGSEGFSVALIPHTLGHTTLGGAVTGRRVNLEVDVLAKYVEALVAPYRAAEGTT